jgi:hypothetical protein
MLKPVKRDSKKLYSCPKLSVYGTVQQLTQKVGLRQTADGGPRFRTKTHL